MSKLSRLADKVRSMLIHAPVPYYPFMFGFFLIMWGIWIMLPGAAFTSTTFGWIVSIGFTEFWYGLLAVCCGSVLSLGAAFERLKITRIGMLLSFYFWLFTAFSFAEGNWHSPAVITASFVCIMSGLAWVNRKVRAELNLDD